MNEEWSNPKVTVTDLKFDVDGIFIKVVDIADKGVFLPQHSHTYDHVSFIATGSVWIECDGKNIGHFVAPKAVTIKAGTKHLFLTTSPNTRICCIHRVDRNGDIEIDEEHILGVAK